MCGRGLQVGKEPDALTELKAEGRMAEYTRGSQLVSSAGPRRPLPMWFRPWKISAGEGDRILFFMVSLAAQWEGRRQVGREKADQAPGGDEEVVGSQN